MCTEVNSLLSVGGVVFTVNCASAKRPILRFVFKNNSSVYCPLLNAPLNIDTYNWGDEEFGWARRVDEEFGGTAVLARWRVWYD